MDIRLFYFILIFCCFSTTKSELGNEDEILKELKNLLRRESEEVRQTKYLRELFDGLVEKKDSNSDDLKNLESKASEWLEMFAKQAEKNDYYSGVLDYAFLSNITDVNRKKLNDFRNKQNRWARPFHKRAREFLKELKDSKNETLKALLKSLSIITTSANETKNRLLLKLQSKCESIYGEGKVEIDGKEHRLEPDLTSLLAKSRDPKLLEKIWVGWRNDVGRKIRKIYPKIIELSKEINEENGIKDSVSFSLKNSYGDDIVEQEAEDLYKIIKPLYSKLHAYVRYKLHKLYGDYSEPTGKMKANLLGNMWAQQWPEIIDVVAPYPELLPKMNFTEKLVEKNFKVIDMVKTAEEFFTSIGLFPMTEKFWKYSMFEKPTDGREVVCHPSAFDLGYKNDYRIKMCGTVSQTDFLTLHHEMGHIEYYMSYRPQPYFYRNGANPAFHEAVGDTIALSAGNPTHLKTIKLYKKIPNSLDNQKRNMNYLMQKALEKLTVVPWALVVCKWTWGVERGLIKPENYNKEWWYLREKYQGLKAPVKRNDDLDLDPASKYHVASFTPYLRYLFSFVAQFQFHEALCKEMNYQGLTFLCDIYRSKEAGDKLKNMLKVGSSQPWRDLLKEFTGKSKFDSHALRNFFDPLEKWLDIYIEEKNIPVGW